eukprot:19154-Chlamydomonas_euryale.AAC.1
MDWKVRPAPSSDGRPPAPRLRSRSRGAGGRPSLLGGLPAGLRDCNLARLPPQTPGAVRRGAGSGPNGWKGSGQPMEISGI